MLQSSIKNQILVESMIQSINQVMTTRDQLKILLQINELMQNVFLLGSSMSGIDIQELLRNQILVQQNGKLEILPVTNMDRESYLLAEIGTLLSTVLSNESEFQLQERFNLLHEVQATRRFLHEEIKSFMDYLFNPKDDITNEKKLVLYLILSEEYKKILQQKDITNMSIVGQKTIQMIITIVYERINANEELQEIPKGKLTLLMKKFFIVIDKTVQNFRPI